MDGADAATHDANRGVAGSFDYSLEILRHAKELGVETQINTTLTPANFDQIESMADRFAAFDIALWSVFFLIPVGRASGRSGSEHFRRLSTLSSQRECFSDVSAASCSFNP